MRAHAAIAGMLGAICAAGPIHADEPPVGTAAGGGVRIALRVAGQSGTARFRGGAPLPVAIELQEMQGVARRGRVVVTGDQPGEAGAEGRLFTADVDLPPSGRVVLRGIAAGPTWKASALAANLALEGSATALRATLPIRSIDPAQAWVWVLGRESGPVVPSLAAPRDAEQDDAGAPWIVTAVDLADVPPAWPALVAVDALVLATPIEGVEAPHWRAIAAFTGAGGALLVGGGVEAGALAGPLGESVPVRVGEVRPGSLAPLAGMFERVAPATEVALAGASDPHGRVLAVGPGDAPLAVLAPWGLGRVLWVACGLADEPVRRSESGRGMLRLLLKGRGETPRGLAERGLGFSIQRLPVTNSTRRFSVPGEGVRVEPQLEGAVLSSLRVPAPSRAWIGIGLAGYVALAAGSLWVGRRRRRPGRAWLAVGAAGALGFAAVSATAAATFRQGVGGASLTVIEGALGTPAAGFVSAVAVYVPHAFEGTLACAYPVDGCLPTPMLLGGERRPIPAHAGVGGAATLSIPPRAAGLAYAAGTMPLPGGVTAEVVITAPLEKGAPWNWSTNVRNATPWALEDLEVFVGARIAQPRTAAPGEAVSLAPLLKDLPSEGSRPWDDPSAAAVRRLRDALCDARKADGAVTLFATVRGWTPGARLDGAPVGIPGPVVLVLHAPAPVDPEKAPGDPAPRGPDVSVLVGGEASGRGPWDDTGSELPVADPLGDADLALPVAVGLQAEAGIPEWAEAPVSLAAFAEVVLRLAWLPAAGAVLDLGVDVRTDEVTVRGVALVSPTRSGEPTSSLPSWEVYDPEGKVWIPLGVGPRLQIADCLRLLTPDRTLRLRVQVLPSIDGGSVGRIKRFVRQAGNPRVLFETGPLTLSAPRWIPERR